MKNVRTHPTPGQLLAAPLAAIAVMRARLRTRRLCLPAACLVFGATIAHWLEPHSTLPDCTAFHNAHTLIAKALAEMEAARRYQSCMSRISRDLGGHPPDPLTLEIGRQSCSNALSTDQKNWNFRFYRGVARALAGGDECAARVVTQSSDAARGVAAAILAAKWSEW